MGGWWSGGLGKGGGIVGLLLELGGLDMALFCFEKDFDAFMWSDVGLISISWCMGS